MQRCVEGFNSGVEGLNISTGSEHFVQAGNAIPPYEERSRMNSASSQIQIQMQTGMTLMLMTGNCSPHIMRPQSTG
jgi:hypothetical protein